MVAFSTEDLRGFVFGTNAPGVDADIAKELQSEPNGDTAKAVRELFNEMPTELSECSDLAEVTVSRRQPWARPVLLSTAAGLLVVVLLAIWAINQEQRVRQSEVVRMKLEKENAKLVNQLKTTSASTPSVAFVFPRRESPAVYLSLFNEEKIEVPLRYKKWTVEEIEALDRIVDILWKDDVRSKEQVRGVIARLQDR